MNLAQFQATSDPFGNLRIAGGWVLQPKTGTALQVGSYDGSRAADAQALADGSEWPALPPQAGAFVGGSGRNVVVTGLPAGTLVPVGFYVPQQAGEYRCVSGVGTITVSGATAAIVEGANTIATLASWTLAPVGTYTATTYGQTTYNGGAAFNLTAMLEGTSVGIPAATVSVSAGTAQTGDFSAVSTTEWASDLNADWTVEIAPDGTADLKYLGDAMATRAAGSLVDPDGVYEATETGKTDCNAGEAWTAQIALIRVAPMAGWAYLKIEDVAGALTSVAGPFFSSSLPAPSGNFYYYPLAKCDGSNPPEQLHIGPVQWPRDTGAPGADATVNAANISAAISAITTTETTMADGDHLTFRKVSGGAFSKITWASVKTLLGAVFLKLTGGQAVVNDTAGNVALTIKGAASQTANLQELRDSSNNLRLSLGGGTERALFRRLSGEYASTNYAFFKCQYDTTNVLETFMDGGWNMVFNNPRPAGGGLIFQTQGVKRFELTSTGAYFNVPSAFSVHPKPLDFYDEGRWMFDTGAASAGLWFGKNGTDTVRLKSAENLIEANLKKMEFEASQIKLNTGVLIVPVATPASASAAGVAGSICTDANYVYVCTATNTWKRAAISTW